jgi:hypothetical protein
MLLMGPSGTGKTFQFRKLVDGGWKGLYVCIGEHIYTIQDLNPDTYYIAKPDIPLSPMDRKPQEQDFLAMLDYLRSDEHDYDFVYFDSLMNYADLLE